MTRSGSFLSALLALVWGAPGCATPPNGDTAPSVMVVHGLGRTRHSMSLLAARLERAGFRVHSFGYPSMSESIEELVDRLRAEVDEHCGESARELNFVTHSMGGILVRSYLAQNEQPHKGRVVMLSPPSQGSEIVDTFADSALLRTFLGPAGVRLGTSPHDIPQQLGPANFHVGVITGDKSYSPLSWLIPGDDDGKVSVERARLEGADDFLVLPATHTFIMNRRDVSKEVVHFLRHGEFRHSQTARTP